MIYKQITRSLKNYDYYAFVNKTKTLARSAYDFKSIFLKMDWMKNRDIHRSGLLWGSLDVNLTQIKFKSLKNDDNMSQKFFFGLTSSKLGKKWNRTIIDSISNDPFDYKSIVYYLQLISNNIYDRSYLEWHYAVDNLYYILDDTITDLFPGSIPENYTNIYEHLNETRDLYSDPDRLAQYVDNVKNDINLTEFLNLKLMKSMSRDNSSAGFLWGKFNEIVQNQSNFNNIDTSRNTTEDKYARELVRGLLQFSLHKPVPIHFLRLVNSSVFDYKSVVYAFTKLAINAFNFSRNHTDEERFVEGAAVLSNNIRNILFLAAESSQTHEIIQELNRSYSLFNNHQDLLTKINVLFKNGVDIRYYFEKAYERAQYHSEFYVSGTIWAKSVEILFVGTNSTFIGNNLLL